MATKPLPKFSSDDNSSLAKQLIETQKEQLSVLTDILGLVKNIADNMFASLVVTLPPEAMDLLAAPQKTNELAEKEKERESKLGAGAAKPESFLDSLKKFFKGFFGIFNVLKGLLLGLVFGFIAGFRKKFDLFTVALGLAIVYPIRTFKLMVRVFGFLFEALKSVGKLISKIGPTFQDAVQGITNFFRRMRIFFLRTLDLKNILKPITSLFSSGGGIFQGLAKILGGLFRVLGKLALPLTIIMAVYDGIMGAIEGFKEGGMLGALKGALIGIFDGLVGWLVGIGQWIVSNLLEMFGFDELAQVVDQFNFKDFLKEYGALFMPILTLIDLFDESSPIRKQFAAALDKLSNVGDFVSIIWDSITEAIKNMLIKIGEAIPGGSMLLSALGLGGDDDEDKGEPNKNKKIERLAKQAEERGDTDLAEELRAAKDEDEAKEALMDSGMSEAEARVALDPEKYGKLAGSKPTPVPPQNKAEELDRKTREAETAKKPEPPKPSQTNTTVVNAPNNSKTTANMNPAPQADQTRLGSRGNAAYAGFAKSY